MVKYLLLFIIILNPCYSQQLPKIETTARPRFEKNTIGDKVWSLLFDEYPNASGVEHILSLPDLTNTQKGKVFYLGYSNEIQFDIKNNIPLDEPFNFYGKYNLTLREFLKKGFNFFYDLIKHKNMESLELNLDLSSINLDYHEFILNEFKQTINSLKSKNKNEIKYTELEAEQITRQQLKINKNYSDLNNDEKKIFFRIKSKILDENKISGIKYSKISAGDFYDFSEMIQKKLLDYQYEINQHLVNWLLNDYQNKTIYLTPIKFKEHDKYSIESVTEIDHQKNNQKTNISNIKNFKTQFYNIEFDKGIKSSEKALITFNPENNEYFIVTFNSIHFEPSDSLAWSQQNYMRLYTKRHFIFNDEGFSIDPNKTTSLKKEADYVFACFSEIILYSLRLKLKSFNLDIENVMKFNPKNISIEDRFIQFIEDNKKYNGIHNFLKDPFDENFSENKIFPTAIRFGAYILTGDFNFWKKREIFSIENNLINSKSFIIDLLGYDPNEDYTTHKTNLKNFELNPKTSNMRKNSSQNQILAPQNDENYKPSNTNPQEKKPLFTYFDNNLNQDLFFNLGSVDDYNHAKVISLQSPSIHNSHFLELKNTGESIFVENQMTLPTPDHSRLVRLELFSTSDDHSDLKLQEGLDYRLLESSDHRFYFVELINGNKNKYLNFKAYFKNIPMLIVNPIELNNKNALLKTTRILQSNGFKTLGASINQFIEKNESITLFDLQNIFKLNTFYTFTPELDLTDQPLFEKWNSFFKTNNPLQFSKKFLRKDGNIYYQCDGARELFRVFLNLYKENSISNEFTHLNLNSGFLGTNGTLSLADLHARLIVSNENNFNIIDATPSVLDPNDTLRPNDFIPQTFTSEKNDSLKNLKLEIEKNTKTLFSRINRFNGHFNFQREEMVKSYQISDPLVVLFRLLKKYERHFNENTSIIQLEDEIFGQLRVSLSQRKEHSLDELIKNWLDETLINLKQYSENNKIKQFPEYPWASDPITTEAIKSSILFIKEQLLTISFPKLSHKQWCEYYLKKDSKN